MTLDEVCKAFSISYRWHQVTFFLGITVMTFVDYFLMEGWATFWVMITWSILFGIHFMVARSLSVDDKWVEERLFFGVYRPWDFGHIDQIRSNPYGRSAYRTEFGRLDENGKAVAVKSDDDSNAPSPPSSN
jgi:hypothetical protein